MTVKDYERLCASIDCMYGYLTAEGKLVQAQNVKILIGTYVDGAKYADGTLSVPLPEPKEHA